MWVKSVKRFRRDNEEGSVPSDTILKVSKSEGDALIGAGLAVKTADPTKAPIPDEDE